MVNKNIIILHGKVIRSCTDCKFFVKHKNHEKLSKCLRFTKPTTQHNIDYVMFADIMRKYDTFCGSEARFFKPYTEI